jgi:acyl-CoA dehydrogenase
LTGELPFRRDRVAPIGFTHEHELQNLTRRLWSWRDEFGTESRRSREFGREVMAAGPDALWPIITAA